MKTELLRVCSRSQGTRVNLPSMECPRDERARIEGQAAQQQQTKLKQPK
jgi:hypothetical protein